MAVKKNTKPAASAAKSAPKTRKVVVASAKPAARSKAIGAKAAKPAAKSPAKKRVTPEKNAAARAKEPAAKSKKRAPKAESEAAYRLGEPVLDPIGDETSGEARKYLGAAKPQAQEEQSQAEIDAFRRETENDASDALLEAGPGMEAAQSAMEERARHEAEDKARAETDAEDDEDAGSAQSWSESAKQGPAKLERLQKILSQAGVASRRHAEEMIVAGRVMVNGQLVTTLGSKADAARDHIRVDGKLLHGAERHRYFMLNKPRGYVTTMSDPEGRPTVMEFFAKAKERVYPVGRLDYLSEGLLLMTNDGELANLLTKAGSRVEKTYLVKVAGQPTAEELERLRGGVTIDKGEPGSDRVRTAPARIRPFREGDNPWFEVVLIEGRNRELRKMFAAVGHFAEKIRRVGYGPLVLDVEPGKLRELDEEEVKALRLTAEGKMKPRHAKIEKLLPKKAGLAAEKRDQPRGRKFDRPPGRSPARSFDRTPSRPVNRDDRRPPRPSAGGEKPRWNRDDRGPRREWQPRREDSRGEPNARPAFRPAPRREGGENRFASAPRAPFKPRSDRPEFRPAPRREGSENRFGSAPRPPFKPRGDRPEFRPAPRRDGAPRPQIEIERITGPEKPAAFAGGKPKPAFGSKPGFGGKPGGVGKYRGNTRGGPKRGASRPGAPRGGRKRG